MLILINFLISVPKHRVGKTAWQEGVFDAQLQGGGSSSWQKKTSQVVREQRIRVEADSKNGPPRAHLQDLASSCQSTQPDTGSQTENWGWGGISYSNHTLEVLSKNKNFPAHSPHCVLVPENESQMARLGPCSAL